MAWFKMIGTALVISGFGAWGLAGARGIRKRSEELKELRFAIAFMEKEITYMQTPLSMAVKKTSRMSRGTVSAAFKEIYMRLQAGVGLTAGEAWMRGIDVLRLNSNLKEVDLDIVSAAAHQLGMSSSSDQRKFLELIQEEIKVQEEKARQEQDANQKLWSYGGFILGIVVVLLLI